MEIIDRSPYLLKEGKLSFIDRMRGSLEYGFSWYAELQAQNSVITSMSQLLGNDYTAMHGVTLPDTEINIPLMVVGPTGVYVLYVTSLAGVYRAKGDNWLIQESGRGWRNAHPNLLARTSLMGRAVEVYLKRNGCEIAVQTALLCANPKMFVESIRSSLRVILSDALEKFISLWVQDNAGLNSEEVGRIVGLLTRPPKPVEPTGIESQPVAAPAEKKPAGSPSALEVAVGKINFTARQWIIIGILGILLVCALIGFIILSIMTLR